MKVALCLHGYFDSLQDPSSRGIDGFNHLQRHLYSQLDVPPKVFIHSWDTDRAREILDLYEPVSFCFQTQKDFTPEIGEQLRDLPRAPRTPQTVFSHMYSFQRSLELALDYPEEFDCIVKCRFDVGRINRNPTRTPVQCLTFTPTIDKTKLYIADWEPSMMRQGPPDMWFYGSPRVMERLAYVYNELEKVFYVGSPFHEFATSIENNPHDISNAIIFLNYYFKVYNLWQNVQPLPTEFE